jgi:Concanavalin A-like lectin/glucanases superfamily
MNNGNSRLHFNGTQTYIEIPNHSDFSVATTGELTISAWIAAETLTFSNTEGTGYVHWLGKGETGQQEWTFRIYSLGNTENRQNRISFYVFNAQGGQGIGSHFQDLLEPGERIHVVATVDHQKTSIYRDGIKRDSDIYAGQIAPKAGNTPVRIGTRDFNSFFKGQIYEVRFWNRCLTDNEIANLFSTGIVSTNGLVAEYLLNQDIAPDSAGDHNGIIHSPVWIFKDES